MRNFVVAALTGAVLLTLPDSAEARRGGGAKSQEMHFVSDTKVEIDGKSYALCHLTTTQSALFINLFRSLEGYVLAANNCDSEQYLKLSASDLAEAKQAGLISSSVPDEPKLSTGALIEGHWGWALVVGVLAFVLMGAKKAAGRRKERQALMGNASPAAIAILDAMCHAAKVDGMISGSEVEQITHVAVQMTGENLDIQRVKKMANLAEEKPGDGEFKRLVKGRTEAEKELMMRGVLMVVAADGRLDGKEQQFVGQLAKAMKMPSEKVGQLLGEVVGSQGGNAAA